MTSPEAIRQRRYRLHRKGDHSECLAERCSDAITTVTSRVTRQDALGSTGRALWVQMTTAAKLGPAELALLLEACRIADRLDKLEAQLSGEDAEWLRVDPDFENPTAPVVVVVERALAEARQQAVAMRSLLAEIRQAAKPAATLGETPGAPQQPVRTAPTAGGGNVLDLAAGIAARRANPAAG